jgi:PAS domain S-box-containing protein
MPGKDAHRELKDLCVEQILHERTHQLRERAKELNCLYAISKLLEKPDIPMEEIFAKTVNVIPPAWQYPEITCARILFKGLTFQTEEFVETIWRQASKVIVNGEHVGTVEAYYREERPTLYEGPFLKEERDLIDAIAEKLGNVIQMKSTEESLRESEERYRILTEKVEDGVTLIQDGRFVFVNHAFLSMFGFTDSKEVVGKRAANLIPGTFDQNNEKIFGSFESGCSGEKLFRAACITIEGHKFWVEGHRTTVRYRGKPACLLTIRDITERRLREQAIEAEAERLRMENISLRFSMQERFRLGNIIGMSPVMQEVYELILKAANSSASVIICGESGTGKELVAWAIHENSDRRSKEFVPVNCGAIPEELLESEFFGHKKGAFTSAHMDKAGYIDLANGGTLFLDEIAELSLNMQVKLLRTIDGGEYTPVGSNRVKKCDLRIIAATNRNLMEQVKMGLMREDFFYRIHVLPINLPSLRERKEDIPLLVDHFLRLHDGRGKPVHLSGRIMDALLRYHWPGNVRELQNVLQRYMAVKRLDFLADDLSVPGESNPQSLNLVDAVEKLERSFIVKALDQSRWNRSKTAGLLGISRRALFRKMTQFGIS